MSALVIDASITLSWLLPDEASAVAIAVRDDDLLLRLQTFFLKSRSRLTLTQTTASAEKLWPLPASTRSPFTMPLTWSLSFVVVQRWRPLMCHSVL